MIPSKLLTAFEETHYVVHYQIPFTLRIGQNSAELDSLLKAHGQSSAAFITAWNPMCQQLSDAENEIRHQTLLHELKRCCLRWIPGVGCHPSNGWPEEKSVIVLGIDLEVARRLSQKFKQMACVFYRRSGQARLIESHKSFYIDIAR